MLSPPRRKNCRIIRQIIIEGRSLVPATPKLGPRQGPSLGHAKVVLATRQVASWSTRQPSSLRRGGGRVHVSTTRVHFYSVDTLARYLVIVWARQGVRDRARVLIGGLRSWLIRGRKFGQTARRRRAN